METLKIILRKNTEPKSSFVRVNIVGREIFACFAGAFPKKYA